MDTQIIGDQYPLAGGIGLQDRLQELNEAGAVPPRAAERRGQPSSRFEGAQPPDTPPASVVGGAGGPARALLPDLTGIHLGTHRPELVEADDPPLWARLRIGPDNSPLFSAKA
jgi:hypothetical protein